MTMNLIQLTYKKYPTLDDLIGAAMSEMLAGNLQDALAAAIGAIALLQEELGELGKAEGKLKPGRYEYDFAETQEEEPHAADH